MVLNVEDGRSLDIHVDRIECLEDDERGVNVFNCVQGHMYFCVQVCQYLEGDDLLDLPYFEYCDQSSGQYADLAQLGIHLRRLDFVFSEGAPFVGRYGSVRVSLAEDVDAELVGFLLDSMFFGDKIVHLHGIPDLERLEQSVFRVDG